MLYLTSEIQIPPPHATNTQVATYKVTVNMDIPVITSMVLSVLIMMCCIQLI